MEVSTKILCFLFSMHIRSHMVVLLISCFPANEVVQRDAFKY
jgi:hypothetical protein